MRVYYDPIEKAHIFHLHQEAYIKGVCVRVSIHIKEHRLTYIFNEDNGSIYWLIFENISDPEPEVVIMYFPYQAEYLLDLIPAFMRRLPTNPFIHMLQVWLYEKIHHSS